MEQNVNVQEVAANNAAVVANNVEVANAATTSVEPKAAEKEAAKLLDVAKGEHRKEQSQMFGRHFSGTTNVVAIKKGAIAFLQSVDKWKQNLEALLQEIAALESEEFFTEVEANADAMTAEEIQEVIAKLQAKAAAKVA